MFLTTRFFSDGVYLDSKIFSWTITVSLENIFLDHTNNYIYSRYYRNLAR